MFRFGIFGSHLLSYCAVRALLKEIPEEYRSIGKGKSFFPLPLGMKGFAQRPDAIGMITCVKSCRLTGRITPGLEADAVSSTT